MADDNCFSFVETLPGGFVPRFGGDNEDWSIVGGIRGELDFGTGLGYDLSFTRGNNQTEFFINNTINASLGPDSPRDFNPGAYEQSDTNFNVDLNYAFGIDGFASDLFVAAGFEYREEEFSITAGDDASFAIGPLAAPTAAFPTGQGFASSSNGFGGFVLLLKVTLLRITSPFMSMLKPTLQMRLVSKVHCVGKTMMHLAIR